MAACDVRKRKDGVMPLFQRVSETDRAPVAFVLDGQPAEALAGDTVLTAVLTQAARVRKSEFSDGSRAGFCMMGACQDCWMWLEDGRRVRACSTFVATGMRLLSSPPAGVGGETPNVDAWPQGEGQA